MKRLILSLALALGLVPPALMFGRVPPAMAAEPLVADLSKHLVAITTGFAGTDVLLFGAVEGDGEVVVVVRGPNREEMVRRKDKQAGIWINSGAAHIRNAPSFYAVASTKPIDKLAPTPVLERHQIGLDHLDLEIDSTDAAADPGQYRDAVIRLKQKKGLYGTETLPVSLLSHRLFRTDLHFPANVPVGTYLVEVYLIHDGEVVSAQTTPLIISKIGIGADVYDFANQQAVAYGILAIVLAASAGWLAAIAFKK
ncbi:TIGR02186 family protein [Magnetospirillum moscoviense]|uniref:TIGR02186 family protein n=1 Tax=Magnetospirillum moscoviense TaxID=1437059 RepID=A0A178MFV7_9PROT|nr:TIGR02186 family protein [Magnetospirillum moscoviense]OAN47620.1 hypothetical protein A6A05_15520 [Magnetospirillum moscoviense]